MENNYSISLSELSKLYKIDKKVLKKIIKTIGKIKKKKAKSKKVKSQPMKFSKKKQQQDNQITYSYGSEKKIEAPAQSQLQTVIKNSGMDPRDVAIIYDKIKDLNLQNKLLVTDVVPNLVNTSKTESADLFNQMNTRVDTLTEAARLRFNFLLDNVGDWNDKRKFTNPVQKEERDQISNRLSNIATTYDIRVGEDTEDLNPSFYDEQQDDTFQMPPVQEEIIKEKQDIPIPEEIVPPVVEDEKQDVEEEDVEDVEEDVIPKQKKDYEFDPPIGFVVPKQKKSEDIRQYGYRVQYYIKKFNNEPVSKSSEKKYRTGYLQYLKQLKL